MSERDVQRSRSAQVGMLMRAYREAYSSGRSRRGLTQEELLQRMGSVDTDYAQRYSHATVSRWESGSTRPTLQRLQVFAKAVDLSASETAGLILLAGLVPDYQTALEQASTNSAQESIADRESPIPSNDGGTPNTVRSTPTPDALSVMREVFKYGVFRCLGLGLGIVVIGFGLSLVWDSTWMQVLYFVLVAMLVFVQGFLFPGNKNGLREFFGVSVFVLLTTPFLQYTPLNLDHYNFSLITDTYSGPIPYMLGLLVNAALSCSAGLLFYLLWEWQYSSNRGSSSAVRRATWVILPPLAMVYATVVVIANISVTIQLAIIVPVLAILFIILLMLNDPNVVLSERDRRFLLSSIIATGTVYSTLGIATVVAIYVSPDVPTVLPDHNLLYSWDIDFTKMGYSEEEALYRLNLGYMWHAMCIFAYIFFVIGGNVLGAIFRSGRINADSSTMDNP